MPSTALVICSPDPKSETNIYTNYNANKQAKANRQTRLLDLLFPQSSPNRCKKVTKNKIKTIMVMVNFI